jgi:hypothetical protein
MYENLLCELRKMIIKINESVKKRTTLLCPYANLKILI